MKVLNELTTFIILCPRSNIDSVKTHSVKALEIFSARSKIFAKFMNIWTSS